MIHPLKILATWRSRLRLLDRMGIEPDERVLEVGSGQNPNPRANVLCDRFVVDATERNEQAARIDRPFVAGDIYRLPFRERAFDYVICSHVLEHLEDPEAAAAELARVAPRGYLETPSGVNEKILSYPFHRWMINEEEGALHFRPKERLIWDEELNAWFRRLGREVPGFADYFWNHLHELGNVAWLVWEGQPDVVVHRDGEGAVGSDSGGFVHAGEEKGSLEEEVEAVRRVLASGPGPSWKERLTSLFARVLRRKSDPRIDLDELLACPACRAPLHREGGSRACDGCGRDYPEVAGPAGPIPFLVTRGDA